jgi:hypothetical protein
MDFFSSWYGVLGLGRHHHLRSPNNCFNLHLSWFCAHRYLLFGDRTIRNAYRFPYYDYFQAAMEPLLLQVS